MAWKCDLSLYIFISVTCIMHLPHHVQSADLILYHSSLSNKTTVPVEEAERLMAKLNLGLITMFYGFGFKGLVLGEATLAILLGYISSGAYNVIILDWSKEASNPYPTTAQGYLTYAVPNSVKVAEALGLAIVKLVDLGVSEEKIHLMGFSLGAHLMGAAGRVARSKGVTVYRVTGLDPSLVGFQPQLLYTPINQDSGKFVDCHHTDIGSCGMTTSPCHINFFYNAENFYSLTGSHVQPGCEPGYELCGNLCSHDKSVYYWSEALKYPTNFLAGKAKSYLEYATADGYFEVTTYVGYLCNTTYRGDFYLSTNAASPYGKQEAGLRPSSSVI